MYGLAVDVFDAVSETRVKFAGWETWILEFLVKGRQKTGHEIRNTGSQKVEKDRLADTWGKARSLARWDPP